LILYSCGFSSAAVSGKVSVSAGASALSSAGACSSAGAASGWLSASAFAASSACRFARRAALASFIFFSDAIRFSSSSSCDF
jgi:hypothetical protein